MRAVMLSAAVLASTALVSCSAIIDVEADCDEVASCNGYACNAANTECLSTCEDQNDCRSGYLCNSASSECEPSGCAPATPVVALEGMRGPYRETTVTWVDDDSLARGQIVVTAASGQGVGIARFHADTGERIGDAIDNTLGLLRYDNAASRFFAIDATSAADPTRVVSVWRRESNGNERVRTGAVRPTEQAVDSAEDSANVGPSFTAEQLKIAAVPQGFLTVWTGQAGQQRQIEGMLLSDDREPVNGSADSRDSVTIFSDRQTTSSRPWPMTLGGAAAVLYRRSTAGGWSLRSAVIDSSGDSFEDNEVIEQQSDEFGEFSAATLGDIALVAWFEATGDGQEQLLRAALVNATGVVRQPFAVDGAFDRTNKERLAIASDSGEAGVAWFGEFDGIRNLFVQRIDADGAIGTAFGVTDFRDELREGVGSRFDDSSAIDQLSIDLSEDGYVVVWTEPSAAADESITYYRRFVCD